MSHKPQTDSPFASKVFPSPNHGERRNGLQPDILVLHYTGMPDASDALQRLCNPVSEVSAHYFVFENGRILQLVPEARRAWHAGASFWAGETDINSRSIGIEIANPGHAGGLPPFPAVQIDAVISLSRDIVARWRIKPQRVLAHSDVAPGRKTDPGEAFPWQALHEAGVGHWATASAQEHGPNHSHVFARGDKGPPIEALQAMLALYGYRIEITGMFDDRTEAVVTAFQRHFRQAKVDGIADVATVTLLRNLLKTQ